MATSEVGLVGLAVMGQNLALNIAEKGFKISVHNRSYDKTQACVKRAEKEGLADKLTGYEHMEDFVMSLQKPRRVIILVQASRATHSSCTLQGTRLLLEDIIFKYSLIDPGWQAGGCHD